MNRIALNNGIPNTLDICVWEMNMENNSVNYISTTAKKIFGISKEQYLKEPSNWYTFIHPDDLSKVNDNQKGLFSGLPFLNEYRIIHPDGKIRWLMTQTFPKTDHNGQIQHLLGITIDITDKKNSELKLIAANKELGDITTALHLTADVTITDSEGVITYANDKFCEISKFTREELIGQNHRLIKSGYHSQEVYKELWDTITQGKAWHNEIKNKAKDGTYFWSDSTIVPFLDETGVPYQYIAIRKDITDKKKNEEVIRKLAFEDILTGLPNKRSLDIQLKKLCQNKEEKFAVLFIGLDYFKLINDHYGFKMGNKVLIEVSKRLKNVMKEKMGFTSHLSGDEFVILLERINPTDNATQLAEDILKIINKPIQINDKLLHLTTSIGISYFPDDGNEGGTLLEKADIALNKGKINGKNQYHQFTKLMDVESFKHFSLQNDIRKAVVNEEFFIQYQPKVETNSNRIIGAEALVRWEHPKWGTIPPNEFISIAEETGVIIELGEWILRHVCLQMNEWKQKGYMEIPIAVNFSPLQFLDPTITNMILTILQETNIEPKWLEIEITENIILKNYDVVLRKMSLLKNEGISFSIDDFGTGYSSLKTLKQLHFDILKIDRSFIKDLHYSEDSLQITKAIIQLAHTLDMKVVAEGVDDSKQLSILKEQKCDFIQGYSYSKPIHAKEFEKLLQSGKCLPSNSQFLPSQNNINRRQYFRILFKSPLLGSLTVQLFNNRPVQIGSSSILIEDISAGGLCYQSNIKFPFNKGFLLGIKTKILDQTMSFQGRNIWCKEVDNDLYQYGFEYDMEESERANIIPLLNQLQVKYRNGILLPGCSFIQLENKAQFFREHNVSIEKL